MRDMQKDYFCHGTGFWQKNLENFSINIRCFIHENKAIGIPLFFQYKQLLTKSLNKYLSFLKIVQIFPKNTGTEFTGS